MQGPDLVDYLHESRLSNTASLLSDLFYCICHRASSRERGSCNCALVRNTLTAMQPPRTAAGALPGTTVRCTAGCLKGHQG